MKSRGTTGLSVIAFALASSWAALHWQMLEAARHSGRSSAGQMSPAAPAAHQPREPAPPLVLLDTRYLPPTGRSLVVAGGDAGARNFQAALDQANPGDVITLQAGATFVGNFTLPEKAGAGWVIVRTSASDAQLPAPGTRLTPVDAPALPKVISPNADAAVKTLAAAHHYRFIGIEFGLSPAVSNNHGILLLGDGSRAQRTLASVPHDLIIDRCYIHGHPTANVARGVALNSARTAVIDSYIAECHGVGFDTQAIAGWNGPGPFKIVNNYLEGAGENLIFGGADPRIPDLVPADIEVRANHCFKPLAWKPDDSAYAGTHWTVKNLFELKNARRVLVAGNLFEHNWADAQNGFAILFTVRNQDGGAPWSVVEDVTFSDNVVRHSAGGVNLLGRDDLHPSEQTKRILIRNNFFEDVGGRQWGVNGRFLQATETDCVTVDHNTVLQTGNLITAYGRPSIHFVFTNNLAPHNEYGVIGDDVGSGSATIDRYFPGGVFKKNLILGGRSQFYPADNFFPPRPERGETASPIEGNDLLAASRRYKKAGTDGRDLGCELSLIKQAAGLAPAGRPWNLGPANHPRANPLISIQACVFSLTQRCIAGVSRS